jgi:hypothetical protein
MKKTSIASLQERLTDWLPWDEAMYQVGATLGFWPEFGAPHDNDPWHGVKDVMHTRKHEPLGAILEWFLKDLVEVGCLESKTVELEFEFSSGKKTTIPIAHYRWNVKYKGPADLISML